MSNAIIEPVLFIPNLKVINRLYDKEKYIKDQPMLYGASIKFALENGGQLCKDILYQILEDVRKEAPAMAELGYHPVIDTKKYLLMPKMYRNIPGWHCDGVIRKDQQSQPNLVLLKDPILHYSCVVGEEWDNGTEFYNKAVSVEVDKTNVWKSVDTYVSNELRGTRKNIKVTKSGDICKFTRQTLHRAPMATQRGWSYFFRLSFYHMPAMNEIREQVQVYSDINQGW